jgi:ribosomal protein S30
MSKKDDNLQNQDLENEAANSPADSVDPQIEFTPVPKVITKETTDINESVGSFGKVKIETPSVEAFEEVKEKPKSKIQLNFEKFNVERVNGTGFISKFKL